MRRDNLLNRDVFVSLLEAHVLVTRWRKACNAVGPHSLLGNLTPEAFAGRPVLASTAPSPREETWALT